MSISARERQALDSIENDLAASGPELAAKLAVFARLTAGEEMPQRERLWRGARAPKAGSARAGVCADTARGRERRISRMLSRRAAWRLLWLALIVALFALALTANHGAGKAMCMAAPTAACGQTQVPAPAPG